MANNKPYLDESYYESDAVTELLQDLHEQAVLGEAEASAAPKDNLDDLILEKLQQSKQATSPRVEKEDAKVFGVAKVDPLLTKKENEAGLERKLELPGANQVAIDIEGKPPAAWPFLRNSPSLRGAASIDPMPSPTSPVALSRSEQTTQSPGAFAATVGTPELQRNATFHADMIQGATERTLPPLVIPHSPVVSTDHHDGLVVANEVADEPRANLPEAQQETTSTTRSKMSQQQQEQSRIFYGLGVIAVVAAIVLLLVFTVGRGGEDVTAPTITVVPTAAPTLSPEETVLSLLPEDTVRAIRLDAESPQAQAFKWLMDDPNLEEYSLTRTLQRFVLVVLYFATNGDQWFENRLWLDYEYHECTWYSRMDETRGNTGQQGGWWEDWVGSLFAGNGSYFDPFLPCEGSGEQVYTHLWLYNNQLEGTLPNELYLLTSLKSVFLDENKLTGSILPSDIGMLSNLELCVAWSCGIVGTIPTQVGLLTNVQEFIFSDNSFTGTLPTEFGLLSENLKWFGFDNCELTGAIPTEWGQLSRIQWFMFWANDFTGTIPTELCKITDMDDMVLEMNQLTGQIPSCIGDLTKLTTFWLHENAFTGPIPSEIGKLTLVDAWQVSKNQITGTIPTEIFMNDALRLVYVDGNQLTGQIPSEIGFATALQHFHSTDNQLTGWIPSEIGLSSHLIVLDVEDNQLSGPIPTELGSLANFSALYLARNHFTGGLSDPICQLGISTEGLCPFKPWWWSEEIPCGLFFDCSEEFQPCGCLEKETESNRSATSILSEGTTGEKTGP